MFVNVTKFSLVAIEICVGTRREKAQCHVKYETCRIRLMKYLVVLLEKNIYVFTKAIWPLTEMMAALVLHIYHYQPAVSGYFITVSVKVEMIMFSEPKIGLYLTQLNKLI